MVFYPIGKWYNHCVKKTKCSACDDDARRRLCACIHRRQYCTCAQHKLLSEATKTSSSVFILRASCYVSMPSRVHSWSLCVLFFFWSHIQRACFWFVFVCVSLYIHSASENVNNNKARWEEWARVVLRCANVFVRAFCDVSWRCEGESANAKRLSLYLATSCDRHYTSDSVVVVLSLTRSH